jgi:FG-GAP-like repeat
VNEPKPNRTNASPPSSPAELDRLDSWKEIALFLKRDVSTVQRWEKQEALPIHRHMHGERGTVFAYKSEVTIWWTNRHAKLERAEEAPTQPPLPEETIRDTFPERTSRPFSPSAQRAFGAIGLTIIVAAILFFLPRWRPQFAHRPPSHLLAVIEGSNAFPESSGTHVAAGDVNGDGIADAVVVVGMAGEAGIFFGGKIPSTASLSSDADVLIREENGHKLTLMGMADINGDGMQDLIFLDNLPEPESFTATGKIYVVFGRREWKSKIRIPSEADLTISIPVSYNASPVRAANSGHADLNGDGIDDLIFSANDYSPPDRASAGAVFVFWGRRVWPSKLDTSAADVTILGSAKGEGLYAATVGDVDGDGKNDLIVFAADNTLWRMREEHGRVYGFLGKNKFPRLLDAAKDYDFRIDTAARGDHIGSMTLGDINGDGLQDIILTDSPKIGATDERVLVFNGRKTWRRELTLAESDWQVAGSGTNVDIEGEVSTRDLWGIGADDLIICETRGADAEWKMFNGRADRHGIISTDSADMTFRVNADDEGACRQDPAIADFDGKHMPELLVAAPLASTPGLMHAGKTFIYSPYLRVEIDIRPGGYPNIITPGSDGVIAVAILPGEGVDPKAIDANSIRLSGVAPISTNFCKYEPRNQEEALCAYFESKNFRLKPSDRVAILTGKLKDGTAIYGSDSVLVLPQPQPGVR